MTLALIPLFAILNRAAGWNAAEDWIRAKHNNGNGLSVAYLKTVVPQWRIIARILTSDGLVAAYAGLAVQIISWPQYTPVHALALGFVTFAGWWIWRAPGWGCMFAAINGDWRPNGTLSKFVDRFLGDYPYLAGIAYGGARGFIGLLAWAAGLAVLGHPLAGIALLGAGLNMGAVYWLGGIHQRATGQDTGIKISECLFGAVLGACMALALWG